MHGTTKINMLPFVGFAACLFLLYTLMPLVIAKIGAMAVNLNLLSSDFYALLIGLFFFRYKFHFLYFLAFGVIIIGIVVYTVHLPKAVAESDAEDNKQSSCTEQPVTLLSFSYQPGGNVRTLAAAEAQNTLQETDSSCTDQLMSRHDLAPPLADV